MELSPYRMEVTTDDETRTVQLAGEIDYFASLDLKPKLEELTSQCCRNLIIDLNEVTFIDSEGIKALVAAFQWMYRKQGRAQLVGCRPCVQRVLKLTGLECMMREAQSAASD